MAIKVLKDKVINVRAKDKTFSCLETLKKELNMSKADVVELALDTLYKKIKEDRCKK